MSKSQVPIKQNASGFINQGGLNTSNVPYPNNTNFSHFKHQMSNQTLTTDADQVLVHSYRPPLMNRLNAQNDAPTTNRTMIDSQHKLLSH